MKFKSLFDKSKLMGKVSLLIAIFLLCLIVEFFIFSFKGLTTKKDEYITNYNALDNGYIYLTRDNDSYHTFCFPGNKLYGIRIGAILSENSRLNYPITVEVRGYDDKNDNYYIILATAYITPNCNRVSYENIDLKLNTEEYSNITLYFKNVTQDTTISFVRANPTEGLIGINPLRLLIFMFFGFLIWSSHVFNLNTEFFDIKKTKHRAVSIITIVFCLFLTICLCLVFSPNISNPNYSLADVYELSPYGQQLDAFLKGQLNIDIEVPGELLELNNPYDRSERDKLGLDLLWDRAMYDGKYYSYFGIGPILNMHLPFYLITGRILSDALATVIYSAIASVTIAVFLYAYVTIYKKRVHVSFISIACVSVVLSSCIILMAKCSTPFYHLAVVAALCYLMQFLLFLMLAINSKHKVLRPIFLALSGLNYSFLLLSRLNIAIIGAFLVLPVLYFSLFKGRYAFDKSRDEIIERNTKGKLIDFCAIASSVLLTVAFIMLYNYARFDSPFEFGTSYQLTVSDISQNEFRLDRLPAMIYHTLIQPLTVNGRFPFVSIGRYSLNNYGGYLYVDPNFGLFAIPLALGIFLSIFVFKSKQMTPFAKALSACALLSVFFVCMMNFNLGGVIFRYTTDVILISCIASVLFMISFNESIEKTDGYSAVITIEKLFMLFSAFVCLALLFSYGSSFANYDAQIFSAFYNLFH